MAAAGSISCWLMKAEPDPRMEKGHDVSFPVEKFEEVKVTSWEGVRNHEAKKIMAEKMKIGHRVLFYASNTKVPGVSALAKVVKEGYPDHNAWDPNHPYYDPKSKSESPTWMMVDVEFVSRLPHFVSLKLLQHLATLSTVPECISYLEKKHLDGIKAMALLNRGRLSVQPVEDIVYEAVALLGEKGGWEELMAKPVKAPKKEKEPSTSKAKPASSSAPKRKAVAEESKTEEVEEGTSKRPKRGVKK